MTARSKSLLGRRTQVWLLLLLFCVSAAAAVLAAKKSKPGYLGVAIEKLSRDEKKEIGVNHGIRVSEVMENSPAEKGGIQEDDIIQYFNDEKIRNPENLVDVVRDTKPKTEVIVKVFREGKKEAVTVTVGSRKSSYTMAMSSFPGNVMAFRSNSGGGYMGVQLQELNEDLAGYFDVNPDEGVLVLEVLEDSPAEKAGLKSGDVIVEVDEDKVEDAEDVIDILSDFEEGDEVELMIVRKRRKQKIKVELDEHAEHSRIFRWNGFGRGSLERSWDGHIDLPHLEKLHEELEHIDIEQMNIQEKLRKEIKKHNLEHVHELNRTGSAP